MRKIFLFLFVITTITSSFAKPIDSVTAHSVADVFLRSKGIMVKGGHQIPVSGAESIYLFAYERGFVVVASDDVAWPILGYGVDDNVGDEVPWVMTEWLKERSDEIATAVAAGEASDEETQQMWQKLKAGRLKASKASNGVGPLIETQWNQSPYYNQLCPTRNNRHTLAGCVAIAMAQIMRYWKEPLHGTGSKRYVTSTYWQSVEADFNVEYDWENMPLSLNSTSSEAEIDAVATLILHCGVAVNMDYTTRSSGAYSDIVPAAMRTYFGYNSQIFYKWTYTTSRWIALLKSQIDNLHPMYYTGRSDDGGHAFVCDGYDGDDYFHFNWGWGGYCDGYFKIGALNPNGGGAGSNSDNQYSGRNAIVTMEPNSSHIVAMADTKDLSRYGDTVACWVRSAKSSSNDWTATSSSDWLTLSATQGEGGGAVASIKVYAAHNNSGSKRQGTITFTQGDEVFEITFTQETANYDFAVVTPSGQTLYYRITGTDEVEITHPYPAKNDYADSAWYGCGKPEGDLDIPTVVSYDGVTYNVTSIGDYAFAGCSDVQQLIVPNEVTTIGECAFWSVPLAVYDGDATGSPWCADNVISNICDLYDITGDTVGTACGTYTWYDQQCTTDGDYTHTFTAANGCDSVVTLHLTMDCPPSGIENTIPSDVKIYAGNRHIVVEGCERQTVTLYDMQGRILLSRCYANRTLRIDVPAIGVYTVKIGNYATKKVVVTK